MAKIGDVAPDLKKELGMNNGKQEEQGVRRISDLFKKAFEGAELRRFRDVVGMDMLIHDYAERMGRNGRFYVVLASEVDNPKQKFTFICYSQVMQSKIRRAKLTNNLPILAKIVDNDGMFDII